MLEARELGRSLRLAREARCLSQQAVADAIGLPRTAVTGLEGGNRSGVDTGVDQTRSALPPPRRGLPARGRARRG